MFKDGLYLAEQWWQGEAHDDVPENQSLHNQLYKLLFGMLKYLHDLIETSLVYLIL